jgi:hypothetical protein
MPNLFITFWSYKTMNFVGWNQLRVSLTLSHAVTAKLFPCSGDVKYFDRCQALLNGSQDS